MFRVLTFISALLTWISGSRVSRDAEILFVVRTIGFKLLYGLAILHLERRRLVLTAVTANPTADWIARQITKAIPWNQAPRYLIRDRDGSYGAVFTKMLQAMGIRDQPIAPRSPWQNGHVECLIGSIRRECLDHVVVLGQAHLRRILTAYTGYYNGVRTHLALGKDTLLATRSIGRAHRTSAHIGRPSSPVRPDHIIGRDREGKSSWIPKLQNRSSTAT